MVDTASNDLFKVTEKYPDCIPTQLHRVLLDSVTDRDLLQEVISIKAKIKYAS